MEVPVNTNLMMGCLLNDVQKVRRSLLGGNRPEYKNYINPKGYTALMIACNEAGGRELIVQILLEAGVDVNTKSPLGVTALGLACELGLTLTIRSLLEAGARADVPRDPYPSGANIYPLYFYCKHATASLDILTMLHDAYPEAVTKTAYFAVLPLQAFLLAQSLSTPAKDDDGSVKREALGVVRFLLKLYPEALDSIDPLWAGKVINAYLPVSGDIGRAVLRVRPQLNMALYRKFNWEHRRAAMWLALGTLVGVDGGVAIAAECTCLRRLGVIGPRDMLREIISYL
jgi:Ankyrin repeats (3 copies)